MTHNDNNIMISYFENIIVIILIINIIIISHINFWNNNIIFEFIIYLQYNII